MAVLTRWKNKDDRAKNTREAEKSPVFTTKGGMRLSVPEYDYQVLRLTEKFYEEYPPWKYPEIMDKRKRGYSCLLIETHYDFFICIPYRTEIHHKYAYHFKNSKRSKRHHSGVDFTKMIIIKNPEFIDYKEAEIDPDEYAETRKKIYEIVKKALRFLDDYIMHNKGEKLLNQREYDRRYKFCSLKYFHKELGLKQFTVFF